MGYEMIDFYVTIYIYNRIYLFIKLMLCYNFNELHDENNIIMNISKLLYYA